MPEIVFVHCQSFARKPNKAGQCVTQVIGEGLRFGGYHPRFFRMIRALTQRSSTLVSRGTVQLAGVMRHAERAVAARMVK